MVPVSSYPRLKLRGGSLHSVLARICNDVQPTVSRVPPSTETNCCLRVPLGPRGGYRFTRDGQRPVRTARRTRPRSGFDGETGNGVHRSVRRSTNFRTASPSWLRTSRNTASAVSHAGQSMSRRIRPFATVGSGSSSTSSSRPSHAGHRRVSGATRRASIHFEDDRGPTARSPFSKRLDFTGVSFGRLDKYPLL